MKNIKENQSNPIVIKINHYLQDLNLSDDNIVLSVQQFCNENGFKYPIGMNPKKIKNPKKVLQLKYNFVAKHWRQYNIFLITCGFIQNEKTTVTSLVNSLIT